MVYQQLKSNLQKLGCHPDPTAHMLKSGVAGRRLYLMGITPHCVTYCRIAKSYVDK